MRYIFILLSFNSLSHGSLNNFIQTNLEIPIYNDSINNNEDILVKIKKELQARDTRGGNDTSGFKTTGILDMPWREGVVDFATYNVPTSAVAETDVNGTSVLKGTKKNSKYIFGYMSLTGVALLISLYVIFKK